MKKLSVNLVLTGVLSGATGLGFVACTLAKTNIASTANAINTIAPAEASTMFSSKQAVIVDVREDSEWNAGHINGAIHIPLGDINNRISELAAYKDSPVIMQCRSGKRSAKAAAQLQSAGFSKVYNLDGGISAWEGAGLPVGQ